VVQNFDQEKRKQLIENVLITGFSSAIPGMKDRMETAVKCALLTSDEILGDGPSPIHMLDMPKYMENIYKKTQYAEWVGASITAKIVFPASQLHITRADYNESGPNIIHTKSFA